MRALLIVTIAVGALIGLSVPAKRVPARPAAAAAPRETVLERAGNGHFYAVADVGGMPIKFMVDTGATGIALTVEDARLLGFKLDPANFYPVGRGASGEVRGQEIAMKPIDIDGKRAEGLSAIVAEGLGVSLLGQSYLRRMKSVEIAGDEMRLR